MASLASHLAWIPWELRGPPSNGISVFSEGWDSLPGGGLHHGTHVSNYDKRKEPIRALPLKILGIHCNGGATVKGSPLPRGPGVDTVSATELRLRYSEPSPGLLGLRRKSLHDSP